MDYVQLNELQAVFRTAIEKEREAQRLYEEAAKLATKRSVRKLFMGLMHEEIAHEKRLEKEYLILKDAFA